MPKVYVTRSEVRRFQRELLYLKTCRAVRLSQLRLDVLAGRPAERLSDGSAAWLDEGDWLDEARRVSRLARVRDSLLRLLNVATPLDGDSDPLPVVFGQDIGPTAPNLEGLALEAAGSCGA